MTMLLEVGLGRFPLVWKPSRQLVSYGVIRLVGEPAKVRPLSNE